MSASVRSWREKCPLSQPAKSQARGDAGALDAHSMVAATTMEAGSEDELRPPLEA